MIQRRRKIVIIGGGASGIIAAANLSRSEACSAEIVVVERRAQLGRGLAYSTKDPGHLLNVRASNMSAFADDPDHFCRWLQAKGPSFGLESPTPFSFVPRPVYGEYIADLLKLDVPGGVQIVHDECIDLTVDESDVRLVLRSRGLLKADILVLATGNDLRPSQISNVAATNPWAPGALDGIDPNEALLVIGTGLTMVDVVLSLDRHGHRGPIIAVSRRGLLPCTHQSASPHKLLQTDVPIGAPLSAFLRWLRRRIRAATEAGGDWRSVIDSLRPFTQMIWQSMTPDQKRRFLRHARPWWDIHRHRMAPGVSERIDGLLDEGRLRVRSAHIVGSGPSVHGTSVTIRNRHSGADETIDVAAIFDCTGLPDNPKNSTNRLIRRLFERGLARTDPLAIGLDVTNDGAVIDASGTPSQRIFAVGPVIRGVFWEIIAIPDIRAQCAGLVARL